MNNGYSIKLALSNIKNHKQIILPFILTCIVNICMFYNMISLTIDEELVRSSVRFVLELGVIVIAFFSIIFTFYTNSFLVKRRLKEFGLYNILGMEKKHVSVIVLFESIIIMFVSTLLGLLTGILFNKLFGMLLIKLAGLSVSFGFKVSMTSLVVTTILFLFIFFVNYINTVRHIYKNNPIDLLKGSEVGEKEPKIKWLTLILGITSLSTAYYFSQTTKSVFDALMLFFVAVLLVIVGTHFLFQAGSIAILKALKNNKNFYYKIGNFTSISSLMYRMKQNATGLANICILSTMVLVMLSSTVCLYMGLDDYMNVAFSRRFQANIKVDSRENFNEILNEFNAKLINEGLIPTNEKKVLKSITVGNFVDNKFETYKGKQFKLGTMVIFIDLNEFNKSESKNYILNSDEVLIYPLNGKYDFDNFAYGDKEFKVKEVIKNLDGYTTLESRLMPTYYVVVDDVFSVNQRVILKYDFDLNMEKQDVEIDISKVSKLLKDGYILGRDETQKEMINFNGTFFFLGIFLGTLFIVATCLIIYYKQLQEGYDDKKRYEIMQKVGMDHSTIKSSINKQILIVFFMPLIFAIVHIGFAFKMISQLLLTIGVYNPTLFIYCILATIFIFSLIYLLIYKLTSRVYYNIIQM